MWCIGEITLEYRQRMYELLDLYHRPYNPEEPVVCLDEKSKQLLAQTRDPLPLQPGRPRREDYEYRRAGTCNIFVAVEPKGGRRQAEVTHHRTKVDLVAFVTKLATGIYATAKIIHVVLDNLNTHFRASFEEVLGVRLAATLLRRVRFHYTPKHASWLNLAELEIGVMEKQCTAGRVPNRQVLKREVGAWQNRRNRAKAMIQWNFTRRDADRKLGRHYVS